MLAKSQVERSRAIQRRTGSTFYFATKFLPGRVREPTHGLYAFFLIADEVVDDVEAIDRPCTEKREALESFRVEALDEGFQLTNFLRDVREDVVDRDRIYPPRRTLERHGVDSPPNPPPVTATDCFPISLMDRPS